MGIINTLLIINYVLALICILYIIDERFWAKLTEKYKSDPSVAEFIMQPWFRHVMCILFLIPGFCLYLLAESIFKKIYKAIFK